MLRKTLINKKDLQNISDHLFQRIGLGAPSDISWGVIFRRDEALDSHISTMDS